jgi:hypothetical protein
VKLFTKSGSNETLLVKSQKQENGETDLQRIGNSQ